MTPADHNPFIEMVDAIKFLDLFKGIEKPKLNKEFFETLQQYLVAPDTVSFDKWYALLDVCDKMLEV